ncbi:hypothetical protein JOM56_005172, partial [Amanita muscaria]
LFSTIGDIPDMNLDNTRDAIGLQFSSLVHNLTTIKTTDTIAKAYPDVHYHLKDLISRRNWLIREYETTAPTKWSEIADSVYNDIPTIKNGIIAALEAQGYPSGD